MEQNNITTDDMNEAIAVFDGWQLKEEDGAQFFEKSGDLRYHYELKYHTSWDALMPVVQKVPKLIHAIDEVRLRREATSRWKPIENELCNFDLTNVHYCLYKFIEWHKNAKCSCTAAFKAAHGKCHKCPFD